jgi:hypothetical protein
MLKLTASRVKVIRALARRPAVGLAAFSQGLWAVAVLVGRVGVDSMRRLSSAKID